MSTKSLDDDAMKRKTTIIKMRDKTNVGCDSVF